MTKKNKIGFICILLSALMMVGCGSELPELSDEQMELVADYSAALLMKYDSKSPSRLLPVGYDEQDNVVTITRGEFEMPEEKEEGESTFENTEPEVVSEDLDVYDNVTGENDINHQDGFADHVAGMGINIEYSYLEVLDSYPEDGGNAYFSTDATEGNKLLVMHFLLSCTEGDMQTVNMADLGLKYRVSVNGGLKKKVMTTMLDNDILTYKGSVVPNQMVDLVAIAEIPESDVATIDNLVFTIKGEEFSTTIQLQ